jgi:hypothetical protein
MAAQKLVDILKSEGVKVVEHDEWRSHNRNSKGNWGPLYGVMIHHTASSPGADIVDYCYRGSTALPGPLCHGVIAKDGTVHLVGWGRANHAGGGDPDVLEAVKHDAKTLPDTHEHEGSSGAVDGNAHFIGFECVNQGDGKDPWPAVQLTAMQRAAAAICRHYGWTAESVIRHLDWSDYKSDPKGVDWTKFQAGVQKLLNGDKPSKPAKPHTKPTVSVTHLVRAARRDPEAPQGEVTHKAEVLLFEKALVKLHYLDDEWADGSFGTRTKEAVRRVQLHLGYISADDVDGVPGKHSATWIGLKTGLFTITD